MEPECDRKPESFWRKVDLPRTPKAVVGEAAAAQACGRMVEEALDRGCCAMAEAAAPSSVVAGEGVMALSSGAGAVREPSFAEGRTSGVARTCACVPALMFGATAIVIAIGIADHALACSLRVGVAGAIDITGVGG
jgi:hypothetical protein